jgi:hypothetical protein
MSARFAEADDQGSDLPGSLILPLNGNAVEKNARLVRREHRCLALLHAVAWTADGVRRVHRDHLASYQPIEEHPDGGELLLYCRPGKFFAKLFDIRRDMYRTDPLELETSRSAPAEKIRARAMVRAPRVRVPDVRREELQEPDTGFFAGGQDDGRHACSSAGDQIRISFWN